MHYRSGKIVQYPVVARIDIVDWYRTRQNLIDGNSRYPKFKGKVAWYDRKGNGFACTPWKNPYPDDGLVSLDIETTMTDTIPVVIAVTAEKYLPETASIPLSGPYRHWPWGGVESALSDTGEVSLAVTQKSKDWSGVHITSSKGKSVVSVKSFRNPALILNVCPGNDLYGNPASKPIKIVVKLYSRQKRKPSATIMIEPKHEWEKIRIPLSKFKPIPTKEVLQNWLGVTLQYHEKAFYGFTVRNIAIGEAETSDKGRTAK